MAGSRLHRCSRSGPARQLRAPSSPSPIAPVNRAASSGRQHAGRTKWYGHWARLADPKQPHDLRAHNPDGASEGHSPEDNVDFRREQPMRRTPTRRTRPRLLVRRSRCCSCESSNTSSATTARSSPDLPSPSYAASHSPLATGTGAPRRAFSALRRATSFSRSSSTNAGCSPRYWQALSRPWAMRSPASE